MLQEVPAECGFGKSMTGHLMQVHKCAFSIQVTAAGGRNV
jgi:hypothetical protein